MYGANIYIETNIGYFRKTAIDLADDKKQEEILQLLLRYVYQNDEDITQINVTIFFQYLCKLYRLKKNIRERRHKRMCMYVVCV